MTRPPHFQLYAIDGRSEIRWRLLSANNRELGRAYSAHVTADDCVAAIAHMLAALDQLVVHVRRRNGRTWQWALLFGAEWLVVSSHAYDSPERSEQAAARFLSQASTARIGGTVIETGARRRFRTSISYLNRPRR